MKTNTTIENEILKIQNSTTATTEDEDSDWLQSKIIEVQQQAVLDFWNTIGHTKLSEVEQTLQQQHSLLLEKEQQKTLSTINRLKHKQRLLAKTMAIREYQLQQYLQEKENEAKKKKQDEEGLSKKLQNNNKRGGRPTNSYCRTRRGRTYETYPTSKSRCRKETS